MKDQQVQPEEQIAALKTEVAKLTNMDNHRRVSFGMLSGNYSSVLAGILKNFGKDISDDAKKEIKSLQDTAKGHEDLGLETLADHFKEPIKGVPVTQLPDPGPQVTADHVSLEGTKVVVTPPEAPDAQNAS